MSSTSEDVFRVSGGDIWVINKINDLYHRLGARPSVANIGMSLHFDKDDNYHYTLVRPDSGQARDAKEAEAMDKATTLLGFGNKVLLEFPDLEAVEAAVDRALSLAPRARTR